MHIVQGNRYNLDNTEQKLIIDMSERICKQDRSYFTDNFQRDKSIKLHEMNLNGFGAELAFCKLCGVNFDSSTIENENHFNKVDATLKDGRTVDVKNTKYRSGKLIVRTGKEKKLVDIYALMIGVFPSFIFSGWATYDQIINPDLIGDLGGGPSYILGQHQLNKELIVI